MLINKKIGDTTSICGWVKTFRSNRFININDGSCIDDLQCVVDLDSFNANILSQIHSGSSLNIKGKIVESGRLTHEIRCLLSTTPRKHSKLRIQPRTDRQTSQGGVSSYIRQRTS